MTPGDPQNTLSVSLTTLNTPLRTETPTGSPQTPATPSPGSPLPPYLFDIFFAKIFVYNERTARNPEDSYLTADYMNLTSIPYAALPDTLTELSLKGNPLLELDCALLPKSLKILDVSNCNYLERILNLDQLTHLVDLDVSDTPIESLPRLPASLQHLLASHCTRLTKLPALTRSDLRQINIAWTSTLTALPMLPEGLQALAARFSEFEELPMLPDSLQYLDLDGSRVVREGLAPERPDTINRTEYATTTRAWWNKCLRLERYEALHEPLMAAAWHPKRVEAWLLQGEAVLDNIMGC